MTKLRIVNVMSVRMHISHSKTASRRAHDSLKITGLTKTASGGTRRRHFVDPETGMYRGKQVMPAKKGAKAAPAPKKKAASSKKATKAAEKETTKATKSHAHAHDHAAHESGADKKK